MKMLVTAAALVGVAVLAVLLIDVTKDGSSMLSLKFLTSFPSQIFPENGGIYPALIGSLWLLGLTGLISVPLGLEPFSKRLNLFEKEPSAFQPVSTSAKC
jgi:phosphate transport system permease protein